MQLVALKALKWGDVMIQPGQPVPADDPSRNYAGMMARGEIGRQKSEVKAAAQDATLSLEDIGRGWYHVVDGGGERLSDKAMRLDEANAMIEELMA